MDLSTTPEQPDEALLLSAFRKVLTAEEGYVELRYMGSETYQPRLTLDHGTTLTEAEAEAVLRVGGYVRSTPPRR